MGNGNATKKQVQYMVERLVGGFPQPDSADAADALGVAITHLSSRRLAGLTAANEEERMISSVRGTITELGLGAVEVDVNGVGYYVAVSSSTLRNLRLGEKVRLLTQMVVREDSMSLYGFPDMEQRELFRCLTGVTGVGPKLALAVLGHLKPDALRQGYRIVGHRCPGRGARRRQTKRAEDDSGAQDPARDPRLRVRMPAPNLPRCGRH